MAVERRRGEKRRRYLRLAVFLAVVAISAGGLWAITSKARYACEGLNQLREYQGEAIEVQYKQTTVTLGRPGGLGALESFRDQVVEQQEERRKQIARLRAYTRDFPVKGRPYLVDCTKAHPSPSLPWL